MCCDAFLGPFHSIRVLIGQVIMRQHRENPALCEEIYLIAGRVSRARRDRPVNYEAKWTCSLLELESDCKSLCAQEVFTNVVVYCHYHVQPCFGT